MAVADRQIFAYSGVLDAGPGQPGSFRLVQHALSLAAVDGPVRVCYLPTAVGDAERAIDGQTARFAAAPGAELGKQEWHVQPDGTGGYREQPIPARLLGPMLMLA